MPFWTIRPPRKLVCAVLCAAAVVMHSPLPARAELQVDPQRLYRQMTSAYANGSADGWHFADELNYLSNVLDAGRAYELRRRDDPDNLAIKGVTVDLATQLHYNPLTSSDAAEWYVRLAATAYVDDPARGAAARALLAKLDADDKSTTKLAFDADADATANVATYPNDAEALLDQVKADVRAYQLTHDPQFRSVALARAAQPAFPIGLVVDDGVTVLTYAHEARAGDAGYSATDLQAAVAIASHKASAKSIPTIGRVLSHQAYLVITAPADEYFGHTKLSPIGVRNEITRIGKYLDVGWGDRMTSDALWVVDALDDWQQNYPRDYELPRLLLATYKTLGRIDSPKAKAAQVDVRKTLTIDYAASPEAQTLLTGSAGA
jgi:hypothetical protein